MSLAKELRNRITHPKGSADLAITDDDLLLAEEVAAWFGQTHESLLLALTEKMLRVEAGEDTWPHGAPT